MNKNEIIEIRSQGESSFLEFKEEAFHPDSLAKEIVAFANYEGGRILIGLKDDGTVSGVTDLKVEEKIANICRNNIVPAIIPTIEKNVIENETIFIITINKGLHKPYKVKKTNKFYIRVGSTSVEPTNEELIRLFQTSGQLHFEVSPVIGTTLNDLDELKFRDYCRNYRDIDLDLENISQFLYNWQFTDEEKQLTIVGMLFFGKKISHYLPQSGIDMICYAGTDVTSDIVDFKSEEDGITSLIEYAIKFVKMNTHVKASFPDDGIKRKDEADYEPFVIRELITNAFMHRDWSIFGQKIKLSIFADRLELFSPGTLPNTLNLTRALHGVSYYRNPIIAQLLKDYKFADRAGRGLQKITLFYKNNNKKSPDFEVETYFKTILYK